MYQFIIKPFLFLFDTESVHHLSFAMIRWGSKIPGVAFLIRKIYCIEHPARERKVVGLTFKNPCPMGCKLALDKQPLKLTERFIKHLPVIACPEVQVVNYATNIFTLLIK